MSTKSQNYHGEICKFLSIWEINIRNENISGNFDINKWAEDLVCPILNIIFDAKFENINFSEKNTASVDIGDEKKGITYQVTSDTSSEKIWRTMKTYFSHRKFEKFPHLKFFYLKTPPKRNETTLKKLKDKSRKYNIKCTFKDDFLGLYNLTEIIKNSRLTPQRLKQISDLLRSEVWEKSKASQVKRNNDLNTLKWLLSTIHVPSLEEFIEGIPYRFHTRIFYFWEEFNGILKSSLFYIYNPRLKSAVEELHKNWDITLSHGYLYDTDKKTEVHYFSKLTGQNLSKKEEKSIREIEDAKLKMKKALQKLQTIVREKYIEIDPTEASQQAIKDYRLFHKG